MEENQDSQPVILTSPNSVSLSLGIVGTVIGVFGLVAIWVPPLAAAAIPIGVVGFLLSACGVGFACVKQFRSIEMPILGSVLCLAAIGMSAFSTYHAEAVVKRQQAEAAERQKAAAQQREEASRAASEERAASMAQQQHDRIEHWKSQLADLQTTLPDKQAALQTAQTNMAAVQASYDSFMAAKPWLTNSTIMNLEAKLAGAVNMRNGYSQSIGAMSQDAAAANRATYASDHDPRSSPYSPVQSRDGAVGSRQAQMAADQSNIQAAKETIASLNQQIPQLQAQLTATMQAIKKFQNDKLQHAQSELDGAARDLQSAQQQIKQLTDQLSRV